MRERERRRRAYRPPCSPHLLLSLSPSPARAQTYPTRPVVIIVPFAAGGGNDVLARLLAQRMGATLGQQFVIENRPGAGGTTGARAVAKAPHDGYTLMVGHSGVFGVAPSLYANAGYDPRKDLAPVGLIGSFQQMLVVHPSLPIHTLGDLIAAAKREPGKLTYASAGVGSGSHLSTELFTAMAEHQAHPRPVPRHRRDADRPDRRPRRHDDHHAAVGDRRGARRPAAARRGHRRDPLAAVPRPADLQPRPACPATSR